MEARFFNTLTNKADVLKPIRDGEVSIYCCGDRKSTRLNSSH